MLVSERKKFLFVHIQKTGGTSLTRHFEAQIPDLTLHLKSHTPYSKADERYRDYFKAAFVRNPFDRLVSWFSAIDRNRKNPPNLLQKEVVGRAKSFDEFIRNCVDEMRPDRCRAVNLNQVDYLTDGEGRVAVGFIGRFENFAEDARRLCALLELEDMEVPHINSSRHAHYRSYYTAETRKIVEHRFAKDLEYFGYGF